MDIFSETETVAPLLLFISSLVSLILIALQVSSLHKSQWIVHDAQGTRRLLVLSVTLLIVSLSALSATLGLVARQAYRMGNPSRATRASLGGKIIVVILQFGRKCLLTHVIVEDSQAVLVSMYMMFLLNLKALVEPIPPPSIGVLTFGKVRILTAVMSSPLVASMRFPFLPVQQVFFLLIRYARYCSLHCFHSPPRRLPGRSLASALLASLFYTPILRQHSPFPIHPPRERVLDHRAYVACPRRRTCLWCCVRYLCPRWERGFSSAYLPFRRVLDRMRNVRTS